MTVATPSPAETSLSTLPRSNARALPRLTPEEISIRRARPLNQVAKKLAYPRGIISSGWGDIYNVCTNRLGLEFDGWQDGAGKLLMAKREDGMLAHTVGGFGMSVCRQTGKTFFVAGSIFGLSVHFPGMLTIWSAHHAKTHNETFQSMQAFAERKAIAPFIRKVYTGSGDEEVRFLNGSRILFGARERGFGRGIPGVDCLVSDEAQILSERAMQNMLATMNTSQLGLHIYAGTPPTPTDNSESWMRMRDEAWVDGPLGPQVIYTEDLVWIEMGADDDADLDDYGQYAKANPSFPHRTPLASMQRLRRKLKDDGFRREALGIYDKQESSVFDIEKWSNLKDMEATAPRDAVIMVDISPDRRWSTIGVAGEYPDDEDRTLVMVHSLRGTDGVVPKIKELLADQDKSILEVAIFAGGTARILKPDLERESIEFEEVTANEMAAAYGHLQEKIKSGLVVHVDQPELNMALEMTKTRFVQTGEAESFDRREYSVDVSPAVAAAGAVYRWGLVGRMPVFL